MVFSLPLRLGCATLTMLLLGGYPSTVTAQAADGWRGPEHIYTSTCVYCHESGVGPALKGRGLPVEFIRLRLRNGYRAMPAFKPSEISPRDAEGLALWLMQSSTDEGEAR